MCEHCGCNRLAPIADLMAEHAAMNEIAGDVRTALVADDADRARRRFDDLVAALRPHAAKEERGLLAAVRSSGEYVDYVGAIEADHELLSEAVAAASAEPGEFRQRASAFLDELAHHFEREEQGLFPGALAALDGDAWEQVVAASTQ